MYADDTHITYASSDLHLTQSSPSLDLEKLVSNRLTFNTSKTDFTLIGSRQRLNTLSDTIKLSINNVPITRTSFSVKSLRVYINKNLKCHFHVDQVFRKIASSIRVISESSLFVPQSTLLCVYKSLVQRQFDYRSLVLGNCRRKLSN